VAFTFILPFTTTVRAKLSAVGVPHFTPREITGQLFPLEGEWTSGAAECGQQKYVNWQFFKDP